jgi:hypothetical protein
MVFATPADSRNVCALNAGAAFATPLKGALALHLGSIRSPRHTAEPGIRAQTNGVLGGDQLAPVRDRGIAGQSVACLFMRSDAPAPDDGGVWVSSASSDSRATTLRGTVHLCTRVRRRKTSYDADRKVNAKSVDRLGPAL